MSKIVAIHQPNFFPWLGYFDKIIRSDIFIFLDNVQFPKKGGIWSNRVKLCISGNAHWFTAPINRNFSGTREIREMFFRDKLFWEKKLINTIQMNYAKHPFFNEAWEVIEVLIRHEELNIALYNAHVIKTIAQKLDIDINKIFFSSDLQKKGQSNELLANLTLSVGGDSYMCGGGADGYQDENVFKKYNIKLIYQSFTHPVYPQKNTVSFIEGLSIIDVLMNMGWDGTSRLINRSTF